MNKSCESNLLEIIEIFAKIYLSDMFAKVRVGQSHQFWLVI